MNKEQILIILKKIDSLKKKLDNNSKKDYLMIDKKFVEKIVITLDKILKFLKNRENNK